MLKILSMFGILLLICLLAPPMALPLLYAQDSEDTPAWYQSIFFSAGLPLYFSPESHFGSVKPGFGFRGAIGYEWKGKLLRPSVALSSGWSRFPETDRLVESLSFVPVTGRVGFLWPFKEHWGLQADLGLGVQISKTVHYETELDLWMERQSESAESKMFAESRLYIAYMPVPDFLKIYAGGGVDMVFETDGLVPLPVLEVGVSVKPFANLPKKEARPPRERKERPPREPRPPRERKQREPRERRERQPRERRERQPRAPRERTITFVSNGGTGVHIQTVANGEKAIQPDIFKENYTIEGWYRDKKTVKNKWSFGTDTVTRNVTLYAKWSLNQYTVVFEAGGGAPVPDSPVISNHGDIVFRPHDMTKSHYVFENWYTDSELTVPAAFPITVTGDITLYAKWNLNQYTVVFEADGGAPVPDSPVIINHGDIVSEPSGMTKLYYLFENWYTDSALTVPAVFPITVTGNITLYAKWGFEPTRYAVYFKGERGREVELDLTDKIDEDDFSERLLQMAGERLIAEPNTHIWLDGFAAPVGTTDGQITASAARVRYCVEYLMRNYHIPEWRMHQKFHGAQPPDMKRVFPRMDPPPKPDNEEYYQYWRRVEIVVDVYKE